jgi:hypothetical protein
MSEPREHYDITDATFDEFVEFMFDREVVPFPEDVNAGPGPWYWHADIDFDARKVAQFYVALFSMPEPLVARYTPAQLEQAFWAIPSCNIECSVRRIIWDERVSFELRESCVRSMYELYARLFSTNPLETSSNMWWDALAYDWHCGIRLRSSGGEDSAMQDIMFDTLLKILELPQKSCQEAALHGLGHLHHPDTETAVRRFLARNADVDPELKEYALAAAKFEVM